jgi:hypothetical protein
MTNFEYYKTLTIGVIIGASTVILAFYMLKPEPPVSPQPVASKSNFEVVDTYMGCDVVSWTQPNFAQYKYFLHCPK